MRADKVLRTAYVPVADDEFSWDGPDPVKVSGALTWGLGVWAIAALVILIYLVNASTRPAAPAPAVTTTQCVHERLDGREPQPIPCPAYVIDGVPA